MFHPFKVDFYKKTKKISDFILCENESELKEDNVQPMFYIPSNDGRKLFGDIFEYNHKIYILLFNNRINAFHQYKFYLINTKKILSDIYFSIDEEIETSQLLEDVYKDGLYLGNIYLHDETTFNLTTKFFELYKDKIGFEFKSLNFERITDLRNSFNSAYKEQFDLDLYFNDCMGNLYRKEDWSNIFNERNNDFIMPVYESLHSNMSDNRNKDSIIKNTIREYKMNIDLSQNENNKNLYVGSLISFKHNVLDLIKKANNYIFKNKDIILTKKEFDNLNEEIKDDLIIYNQLFVFVNKNGDTAFYSLDTNKEIDMNDKPIIPLKSKAYQFNANQDSDDYNEALLKFI